MYTGVLYTSALYTGVLYTSALYTSLLCAVALYTGALYRNKIALKTHVHSTSSGKEQHAQRISMFLTQSSLKTS